MENNNNNNNNNNNINTNINNAPKPGKVNEEELMKTAMEFKKFALICTLVLSLLNLVLFGSNGLGVILSFWPLYLILLC